MNKKYMIGVDSGSQSTKVFIYDLQGNIITSASEPIQPMITRKPGYYEHPDEDLWESLKRVLNKLMSSYKDDISLIAGIGICSIRCCRVFMKKDGSLAAPVMSWMDIRAYQKYEDEDEICYTGSTSGYLTYRLIGEFKDTAANAYQYQFPVDMNTWKWSENKEHFDSFNIPREKLFDIQMPGTILGYVNEKASKETGLPVGIPVVSTANDKAVEALGAGLIEPNVGLISLGTYITSMVFGSKNVETSTNFFTNLSNIPYQYLYESGGIRKGMWHVTWFKNVIGEEFKKQAEKAGFSAEEFLAKEAVLVSPGSDGLIMIPDWLSPTDKLYKKGLMMGFDGRHTRGHMYRAFLEGIALTLKNHYDAMNEELGVTPNKLIVSGGGSNSDLFMQIIADIYGVKTIRNKVNGSASLGAAISVAVATNLYPDYPSAVKAMVVEKDVFTPNQQVHELYKKINNNVYKNLPQELEPVLKYIYDGLKKIT
jgi:sugar (pentulose or hexulose) kinase